MRADYSVLLIKTTCVVSELQIALGLNGFPMSKHKYNCSVMRYQFSCKVILLICLCSVGLSGLRLHSKVIEGIYSRDPVSQFDKGAQWRLWHTGRAVLAAADIPQASARGEQRITPPLAANSLLSPFLANPE